MTYLEFSELEPSSKITLSQFHEIFQSDYATIKDSSIRGAATVACKDVKIGDKVNNGTRFIEIIAE